MNTLRPILSMLSLATLAAACSAKAPDPAPRPGTDRAVDEITVPSAIVFNPATEGVVQVRRGTTLCTGVMLDAWTVLTGGQCVDPRASSFSVQLGAETITPSQVRFANSGVTILALPRRFGAMAPGFVRRLSPRTPAQLHGHAMTCLAYNGTVGGAVQLVSAPMTAASTGTGFVRLTPTSGLTSWARFDQGTICKDATASSVELDVLVLDASVAEVATGASGYGISMWVNFVRTLTLSQRALVMETTGTGRCLSMDYAGSRVVSVSCDQGNPAQGLYQESSYPLVRLRSADSGFCVTNSNSVMRIAPCSTTTPGPTDRFALTLNADGATYRIMNNGRCASATAASVTMATCNANDATQRFTMRLSTY